MLKTSRPRSGRTPGPPGRLRLPAALVACALLCVALTCGCGSGGSGPESGSDYETREAVTSALESDAELDRNARALVESVKAGQYDLQAALDVMVDQTKNVLGLIAEVTAPAKPGDGRLAKIQTDIAEYLRNRVHQIEGSLGATTPEDFQVFYERPAPGLQAERARIVQAIISYDPELQRVLE